MLAIEQIEFWTYVLIASSLLFYLVFEDEIPIIFSAFLFIAGVYRYKMVASGEIGFAVVAYSRDIIKYELIYLYYALVNIFWGTVVFIVSYMVSRLVFNKSASGQIADSPTILAVFLKKQATLFLVFYGVIYVINIFAGYIYYYSLLAGASARFGLSYLYYFYLNIVSTLLYSFLFLKQSFKILSNKFKIIFVALILTMFQSTLVADVRFTFLGWAIPVFYLFSDRLKIAQKVIIVGGGIIVGSLAFSYLGVLRNYGGGQRGKLTFSRAIELSQERLLKMEDVNFLDGFAMLYQVYPTYLNYQYGMIHLEILLRPIPRVIWPNKPVGGFQNKAGLVDAEHEAQSGATGISPTIFGSFYEEGGTVGVILLSLIYGIVVASIYTSTKSLRSDLGQLYKGILIAFIVALYRGGDVAGIVAIIGMSYWPIFLFFNRYRKFRIGIMAKILFLAKQTEDKKASERARNLLQ